LQRVSVEKDRLFGKFSSTLTAEDKDKIWKSIRDACVQDGALMWANKTAEDLRKNTWGYMKSTALAKIDGRKTTGGKGGKNCILNEVITQLNIPIIGFYR
jgi:hypothetical protein